VSPPDAVDGGSGFTGIVLAAQRAGRIDPLAAGASVSHKCLVEIAGRPLIAHVVAALRATPGLRRLRIVVEAEAVATIEALLPARGIGVEFIAAAHNLADSVHAACRDLDGAIVVTTADNVLLTPGAVATMHDAVAGGADVAIALARKSAVLAASPTGQRRFYRFADDEYSNCNLYAFAGKAATAAAESFRSGGQFAKKPLRLILAAGPVTLALMLLHRLTLTAALARLSRKLKLRTVPVILPDGSHAIDVDNRRTYDAAAAILRARASASDPVSRTA
jgi:GTP:adenosylcobinamide-phosphate guanylyltransferase